MRTKRIEDIASILLEKYRCDGYCQLREKMFLLGTREDITARLNILKTEKSINFLKYFSKPFFPKELDFQKLYKMISEEIDILDFVDAGDYSEEDTYCVKVFFHHAFFNQEEKVIYNVLELMSAKVAGSTDDSLLMCSPEHRYSIIENIEGYIQEVMSIVEQKKESTISFRGHSDINYILQPSVSRNKSLIKNEYNIYHRMLTMCPGEFLYEKTHIEKLLKMQHYDAPTRLLDVTTNPLVALYFACKNTNISYGEVLLLQNEFEDEAYAYGDTVSILCSIATFSHDEQQEIYRIANKFIADSSETECSIAEFNSEEIIKRLIDEVKSEKPAFRPLIRPKDIVRDVFISPPLSNGRIARQHGRFILCSLSQRSGFSRLNRFRYKSSSGLIPVLKIGNKKKLLGELDVLGINESTIFPEIDRVSSYVKGVYLD